MDQDTSVRRQLLALQDMALPELTAKWRDLFQRDPPEYGVVFMRRRLAHRIQELTYGGMSEELRSRLASFNSRINRQHTGLRIGTRLVRSWRDAKYEVTVCENGFEYAGQIFTSLSAVARTITGVNRNGYEFFGIKDRLKND